MTIWDRITTKHSFADGVKISLLHRYALQLEKDGRAIEVGFEQARQPGIDRLIHRESILVWKTKGPEEPVTLDERSEIVARIEEYCRLKGLTFRVVS